jgi:hypothetical protein
MNGWRYCVVADANGLSIFSRRPISIRRLKVLLLFQGRTQLRPVGMDKTNRMSSRGFRTHRH